MTIGLYAFYKKYDGKKVGSGQCRALITAYCKEVLGIRGDTYQAIPRGNAEDIYRLANPAYFKKVRNTPTGVPPIGAIIVWLHKRDGHTGIEFRKGDTHTMRTLDQNWSKPLRVDTELHTYSECLGWLIWTGKR